MQTSAQAARRLAAGRGLALSSAPTAGAWAAPPAQVAVHDAASKRMTEVLGPSRVLTPEQRKHMADDSTQRRKMMQRHCRERQAIEAPKG